MRRRLKQDAHEIVVFLGPSVPIDEARRTLGARYLGPARCGDVLRATRLRPRVIALIDGLFATTAAVWHKEILYALDEGVSVVGASSMGALRAAELLPFGMVGIGKIFEAYRDGVYTDDDEVALSHAPAAFGYRAISEPMVNIRATVAHAVASGVILAESGDRVVECAKRTFFEQRSIRDAIEQAWADGGAPDERARFQHFVGNGGYVDQKRLDALALLRHVAGRWTALAVRPPAGHRTSVFLKLQRDVMCEPFDGQDGDLPVGEQVARQARTLPKLFPLLYQLAQLMSIVHALPLTAARKQTPRDVEAVCESGDFRLGPSARSRRWAGTRGLDAGSMREFVERLSVIRSAIDEYRGRVGSREAARRDREFLLSVLRLFGAYEDLRRARNVGGAAADAAVLREARRAGGAEFGLCRRIAVLWSVVDEAMERSGFLPVASPQSLSDDFRRKRRLERRADTLAWRRVNSLDHAEYVELVTREARLGLLLQAPQVYVAGLLQPTAQVCWLLDAIRLTGLYRRLRARLRPPVEVTDARFLPSIE